MKLRITLLAALCALCALSLAAPPGALAQEGLSPDPHAHPSGAPANPQGQPVQRQPQEGCTFVDFEGVMNLQPVGTVTGTPNVEFGPSWLGIIDQDAGGTGNFANEPTPDTVAFFLQPADPINFDAGVQFLEVFYVASSASIPVTLTAWDGLNGTGNMVDTVQGNTVGTDFDGASCTGDPTGNFCLWDVMELTAPSNTIRSVTLSGATANQFAFDDMLYCLETPAQAPTLPSAWALVLALALLAAATLLLRRRSA